MKTIDEIYESIASHADAVLTTDGQGRQLGRIGADLASDDIAIRVDLLFEGAVQLGGSWKCGGCDFVLMGFAGRVAIIAARADGGHLVVIGKNEVQPGMLLSTVRRAL